MKKIELITTESEGIYVSQVTSKNGEKEYYLIGNNKALVCNDSNYRVSRLSELNGKLKLRDWNVTNRRFAFDNDDGSKGDLQICVNNSKGSGIINEIDDSTRRIVIDKYEFSEEEKTEFNNYLEYLKSSDNEHLNEIYNLYSNMNSSEIYLYSTSKNVVDILNDSITIDIIPYNSDIYTNTVDLMNLITYSISPNISTKIDLGIQYSKNEMRYENGANKEHVVVNEEKLYSKETTFAGPSYNSEGKLVSKDYIEQINNDVVIECINNVIRVVPKSTNIDECIISNCTITYGKL